MDIIRANIQRHVRRWWYIISLVRGIVRWKSHIEHPVKEPIQYVANVANRHVVIGTFDRVRLPQCMSVA